MKKTVMILALAIAAAGAMASDGWHCTGSATNSVMVAPPARVPASWATAWTTNSYDQAAFASVNGRIYWTCSGGNSTNAPSHGANAGTVEYDGNIWWKLIDNNLREEIVVYAAETNSAPAAVSIGNPVRMSGDQLGALTPARVFRDEQGAVYIKGAGTFHVSERKRN